MNRSEDIKELAIALNKAQYEISGAKKTSDNPFFKKSYSDLFEVIKASKEALFNNGLSFCQFPMTVDNQVGVETILMHNSGQFMSNVLLLPALKVDPQSYGSAITYAKRYALQSILGIPSEDDDGNLASSQKSTPKKQTYQKPSAPPIDYNKYVLQNGDYKGKVIASIDDPDYLYKLYLGTTTPIGLKNVVRARLEVLKRLDNKETVHVTGVKHEK